MDRSNHTACRIIRVDAQMFIVLINRPYPTIINGEEPRMENGGGFGAGSQIGSRGWWWWGRVVGTRGGAFGGM